MPGQVKKSAFMSKLGAAGAAAFNKHKADETVFDTGGNLPAGIEGGIAQLVECKFDTYKTGNNAGQYYFYAAGTVVSPTDHLLADGKTTIKIEGLRTSIMEPMHDTPTRSRKTVEDHMEWVLNELRKLGLDTTGVSADNIEAAVASLKEAGPHFRFRTWKGQPAKTGPYAGKEPMTNHVWNGQVEFDSSVEAGSSVEDSSGGAPSPAPAADAAPDGDSEDMDALAEAATNGDQPSIDRLGEIAMSFGMTEEEISAVDTWPELVEKINALATGGDTPEDAPEAEEFKPAKGQFFQYKPMVKGPGGKLIKAAKFVKVEVTGVDAKAKTVALKNLTDGKTTYTKVPFDQLETAS